MRIGMQEEKTPGGEKKRTQITSTLRVPKASDYYIFPMTLHSSLLV